MSPCLRDRAQRAESSALLTFESIISMLLALTHVSGGFSSPDDVRRLSLLLLVGSGSICIEVVDSMMASSLLKYLREIR